MTMGKIYTFKPRFPQAYCHLCNQHYKQIFSHIRGKEHKKRYKQYKLGRKNLDEFQIKDYNSMVKTFEKIKSRKI